MDIIYNWQIVQMNTKPQEGNLMDVVVNVSWVRIGTTIQNEITYTATTVGDFPCDTPSEADFTAYPDLTYDQVCGWLDAGLDVPVINTYLEQQLNNQINPPTIVLPLPWMPEPEPQPQPEPPQNVEETIA